jgi:xylulokinase
MDMALYLGLDCSTQSLTATVIEVGRPSRRVVFEHVLPFDAAFPEFGTAGGVVTSGDGRAVGAPPAMWAAALDRMGRVLAGSGLDLSRIRAVSGAAQQHGSVYLRHGGAARLGALDPGVPLAAQVAPLLSRRVSPVWLDCSTATECAQIAEAVGGHHALACLTGSRAVERFTAAQIRKFANEDPAGYSATARIHLVSSFLASLLIGGDAPVEPGDASGMNLMDIRSAEWADEAVRAAAPALAQRLPRIVASWTIAGELSPYWRKRYGFGRAKVVAWSGDNPSSLVGLGLVEREHVGISLGTSDTVFAPVATPDPDPWDGGHVFGTPFGAWMALTCFANGSLAREHVRDAYGLDWEGFSRLLRETPAGNDGAMLVPWFAPEITPYVAQAAPFRHDLDPADAARNVRAVVEAQAMAMRIHSRWIATAPVRIRATGGAAVNREILQVIADVFDTEVVRIAPSNAASLGAALRAFHADALSEGREIPWTEVVEGFAEAADGLTIRPDRARAAIYRAMLPRYARLEASRLDPRAT